jgi:hypothetical protein
MGVSPRSVIEVERIAPWGTDRREGQGLPPVAQKDEAEGIDVELI